MTIQGYYEHETTTGNSGVVLVIAKVLAYYPKRRNIREDYGIELKSEIERTSGTRSG